MKKKFIIGILILTIIIGLFGAYYIIRENNKKKELEKELANYSTPLLYKVTKEDNNQTIYLFGSIHLANDDAYPLPNEVMNAYNNSDYLAVEFDLISFNKDFQAQMNMASQMLLSGDKTIKDVLTEETYNLLISYLEENNSYVNVYEYYGPAFFYSLISNIIYEKTGLETNRGIDMYFLDLATTQEKKILEMESADYQTEMLLSFSDELYDLLINYSIEYEEESIKATNDLYNAWTKGNEETLAELLSEEVDKELANELLGSEKSLTLIEEYEEKLVTQRNKKMTETITNYFTEDKNVFVVVGLAHIIGDDGIANQLQEKGYKVEKVVINTTELRQQEEK